MTVAGVKWKIVFMGVLGCFFTLLNIGVEDQKVVCACECISGTQFASFGGK